MSVVVLLRGINVGTGPRLAMADLRAIAASCGYGDPRTYVQSGNLVVDGDDDPGEVAATLEAAIAEQTALSPAVVARSADEWRAVLAANPFLDRTDDPTKLHVAFHREPVDGIGLDPAPFLPEEIAVDGREVFFHLPQGLGRSPLAQALGKLKPAPVATMRNWRTVLALADRL